jgi:hypothetical protein
MKGLLTFLFILFLQPVGHAYMMVMQKFLPEYRDPAAVVMGIAGLALVFATRFFRSGAWQSFLGILGGIFIWTGFVEYSFIYAAERFNIGPTPNGTRGEYRVMEYSWGLLIPLLLYLLLHENVRCNFFIWFRKHLRLTRGTKPAEGSVRNWGPRAAFETVSITWAGYVLLLLAYDEGIFGLQSAFNYILFVLCLGGGIFLLTMLWGKKDWGAAMRYAVPTVVVLWSAVETLAKWRVFKEPWVILDPVIMTVIILGFLFFSGLLVYKIVSERRSRAAA